MEEEKPKKIVEQLDDIATEICVNYCKWPDQWDAEKEGAEIWDGPCRTCPLNKLT